MPTTSNNPYKWITAAGLWGFAVVVHAAAGDLLIGRMGSVTSPIASPTTVAAAEGFDLYIK